MELTQEHRSLIENIVRRNPRFWGNEDLVEDFCSEAFKRTYSIISSVNEIEHLEPYINKIAGSAILEVLKNSGRIRKSKEGFEKVEQSSIDTTSSYNVDENGDIVFDIPDPAVNIEKEILAKDEIRTIKNLVKELDSKEKDKRYIDIFLLRYIENYNQAKIAEKLEITQGEVSKRLADLSIKIKNLYNK